MSVTEDRRPERLAVRGAVGPPDRGRGHRPAGGRGRPAGAGWSAPAAVDPTGARTMAGMSGSSDKVPAFAGLVHADRAIAFGAGSAGLGAGGAAADAVGQRPGQPTGGATVRGVLERPATGWERSRGGGAVGEERRRRLASAQCSALAGCLGRRGSVGVSPDLTPWRSGNSDPSRRWGGVERGGLGGDPSAAPG